MNKQMMTNKNTLGKILVCKFEFGRVKILLADIP